MDHILPKLYKEYADAWIAGDASDHYEIVMDEDLAELPKDKTPWIIGFENKFAPTFSHEMEMYNSRMVYNKAEKGDKVWNVKVDSVKFENKLDSLSIFIKKSLKNKEIKK